MPQSQSVTGGSCGGRRRRDSRGTAHRAWSGSRYGQTSCTNRLLSRALPPRSAIRQRRQPTIGSTTSGAYTALRRAFDRLRARPFVDAGETLLGAPDRVLDRLDPDRTHCLTDVHAVLLPLSLRSSIDRG